MSKTRELYAPSDCDGQDLNRTPDEQSGIQQLLDDAEFLGAAYQEVMRMIREDRASLKQLETFVDLSEVRSRLNWSAPAKAGVALPQTIKP